MVNLIFEDIPELSGRTIARLSLTHSLNSHTVSVTMSGRVTSKLSLDSATFPPEGLVQLYLRKFLLKFKLTTTTCILLSSCMYPLRLVTYSNF